MFSQVKLSGVTNISDDAVTALARNCPYLVEVNLNECYRVSSPGVAQLILRCKYLRELQLQQCIDLDSSTFTDIPQNAFAEQLRALDLQGCEQINDSAVVRIINTAPRLRNLSLAKCRSITDKSVYAICRLGKNLHHLHLGHCAQISDMAVMQLIRSCNRIRYIDLANCVRLTDTSVQTLATLPKLKRIGLVKCHAITNRSVLALAEIHGASHGTSSLERVHLSYCTNLTMYGVSRLLNGCRRLTHVSLTGVQEFLRRDLKTFCRLPPPDFTLAQREVFCVFSGTGVAKLRLFLNEYLINMAFFQQGGMVAHQLPAPLHAHAHAHALAHGQTPAQTQTPPGQALHTLATASPALTTTPTTTPPTQTLAMTATATAPAPATIMADAAVDTQEMNPLPGYPQTQAQMPDVAPPQPMDLDIPEEEVDHFLDIPGEAEATP